MASTTLRPSNLRCEYLSEPLGIDAEQPRLSWIVTSHQRNQRQTAYQILVADSPDSLDAGEGTLWDSGRVESNQTAHIAYAGKPLQSGTRCWWTVRVWDRDGRPSPYSVPATWQMGLLQERDWRADWIGYDTESIEPERLDRPTPDLQALLAQLEAAQDADEEGASPLEAFMEDATIDESTMRPSPYLRRAFQIDAPVKRATLYATARGLYVAYLNGNRVGDAQLTPGWTDYNVRIHYQTYDVTDLVRSGANAIGAVLADGWYAGYLGPWGGRDFYGVRPSFCAQLHVELENGESVVVTTDGSWRASDGPIRSADLYHGERYDATCEQAGWMEAGFDDSSWQRVMVVDAPLAALSAPMTEPIRITEERQPVGLSQPTPDTYIFDMGQNVVGWVRLRVTGPRGTRVQLRFGETLHADGTLQTENLRGARATDVYVLGGEGKEVYEPQFTYHGFRYVEVTGYPGVPALEDVTGCVLHTALPRAGTFACSNPTVNRIYENVLWSQRGNFNSVPTDCPQRDERLGWTGDMFAFAVTGAFNMDAASYYTRWMQDVVDAQMENGAFSDVAPRVAIPTNGAPAWGDAGIWVPWWMYRLYGDTAIIRTHYDAMVRWMDYIGEVNPDYLRRKRRNNDYADWVSYRSSTPPDVLATAIWAIDARQMAEMAGIIGRADDVERYRQLYARIKDAFVDAYVSADGRVHGETQTAYLLALYADLIPADLRQAAVDHLVRDIEERDWHLSTGFVGTPFLLPVLSDVGRSDVAYRLLEQESCPSWGYMAKQGSTTIWERWDSDAQMRRTLGEEASGEPTFVHHRLGALEDMNSFNHFALGAVGEWLYRYAAGIDVSPEKPGFETIRIHPQIGGGLDYVQASYRSIRGVISSEWRQADGQIMLTVALPANTTATVEIPTADPDGVTEGGRPLAEIEEIERINDSNGVLVLRIGSGVYHFNAPARS